MLTTNKIFFLIKYQSCHQHGRTVSIVVHELEPAYGGQTACESLVYKVNYWKTNWPGLLCTFPHSMDSKFEMWTRPDISYTTILDLKRNILVSVHWPTFPVILYVVMMVEGLTPLPYLVRHLIRQCTKAGNWSAAWCIANNCSKEIENGTQANNSYWDSLHNKEKEQCFCFVLCLTLVWVNFPVYKIHLLYPIHGLCVCP